MPQPERPRLRPSRLAPLREVPLRPLARQRRRLRPRAAASRSARPPAALPPPRPRPLQPAVVFPSARPREPRRRSARRPPRPRPPPPAGYLAHLRRPRPLRRPRRRRPGGFSFGAPASATPAAFGAAAAPASRCGGRPVWRARGRHPLRRRRPRLREASFGAPAAAAAPAPLFGATRLPPRRRQQPPEGLLGPGPPRRPRRPRRHRRCRSAHRHRARRRALLRCRRAGARRDSPSAPPRRNSNKQQLAAVPAPPADVRNKSVEEIVQGWKASLEADVAEFTKQTEQLREWENEIRASQREIVEVSAYAEKLVVAQQRTEKVLDEVRAYQDDLDGDLDAMERHVDDLFARSAVRPPFDADVEREHAYDLSVRLETQLGGMLDQLKDVVTKLNLSHDENGDEKSRDIMKIVNAHHQSLAYLSAQASKIEAEVVKLERANEAERRAQAAV